MEEQRDRVRFSESGEIFPSPPCVVSQPMDDSEEVASQASDVTSATTHELASIIEQRNSHPMDDSVPLLKLIRSSVIGDSELMTTPFGERHVVYCDYTASGRPLSFIEQFIQSEVMVTYANSHTHASFTGRQTTQYREQARKLVAMSCGADEEKDVVIFTGSGATSAIHKMAQVLEVLLPPGLTVKYDLVKHIPYEERPVVFIGPYEHHSNDLVWRESIAILVTIDEDVDGRLDLHVLEKKLIEFEKHPLKVGSFSAASNVTGVLTDTIETARLLHKYGALSFWDYAAAGPYQRIEMNPKEPGGNLIPEAHKDAIFISPHKFIGCPQSPGVLVAKRNLFEKRTIPTVPGGGTVDFVTPTDALYTSCIEEREEAGTPAIIESIRCGLGFQLKDAVSAEVIEASEEYFVRKAFEAWSKVPNLNILGPTDEGVRRVGIVSMTVTGLHYNFCVALLNDLFGIQSRGGCNCAGPYAFHLLRINEAAAGELVNKCRAGIKYLKPGWFRINFQYFMTDLMADYVIDAVSFLAEHGWRFLPAYTWELDTGLFTHHSAKGKDLNKIQSLLNISYETGYMEFVSHHKVSNSVVSFLFYMKEAFRLADEITHSVKSSDPSLDPPPTPMPPRDRELMSVMLPEDARIAIRKGTQTFSDAQATAKLLGFVGAKDYSSDYERIMKYRNKGTMQRAQNLVVHVRYGNQGLSYDQTQRFADMERSVVTSGDWLISATQRNAGTSFLGNGKLPKLVVKMKPTKDSAKLASVFELYERVKAAKFPNLPEIEVHSYIQEKTKKADDWILVDIRATEERNISQAPGSIHVSEFREHISNYVDRHIVTMCTAGGRSGMYAVGMINELQEMKMHNIKLYNLKGGILAWIHNGLPIYDPNEKPTIRVHGFKPDLAELAPKSYKVVLN